MRGLVTSLFKRNKLYICGIFFIIFLTVTLGTCFRETNQQMQKNLEELQKFNVEDFSFFPNVSTEEITEEQGDYWKSVEKNVEELSKAYDFEWDKQEYLVIHSNEKIVRLFSNNRKINQYKIVEGYMPGKDEIMLDYNYAEANNLHVGDFFWVKEQKYAISAIVLLPDMIAPMVDNTGKMYDKRTQCLAVVTEEQFSTYCATENINVTYSGVFLPTATEDFFTMKQDSKFYFLTESAENPQIFATVNSQLVMNQIIMGFSMGILFAIAIILLLITINEQIKDENRNFGVLKALGYKNIELIRKYLLYFFIVGTPALAGYFCGHFLVDVFYELIFGAFSFPNVRLEIVAGNMILFVIVPAIVFALIAFLWALLKVQKSALSMINNVTSTKSNKLVISHNKKIHAPKYLNGVKTTLMFSRIMVLFFVLFSGFALGVQVQFAYTTYNMTSNIKDLVLQEYNYEYNIRFKETLNDSAKYQDGLKYFCESVRLKDKSKDNYSNLYLYVIDDKNTQLLDLRTKNGEKINLQELEGVVINEWMRIKYDLKKGDEIIVVLDNKEYITKVRAISQSVYGLNIYVGKETAENIFGINSDNYNGIYTNNDTIVDEQNILSTTTKTEIQKTIEQSTGVYVILSVMLFVCGLVVGVITLMLSLFSVMRSNRKHISLMKVLGYTQKECNYTIVSGYRKVTIVGFLVSIPYTIILCTLMFNIISTHSNMAYPTSISLVSIVACFLLTVIIVETILWLFRKKIEKVSFREIMEG